MVFTLPHALNALAQGNPRVISALLFRAAADTLLTFGRDPRHLGGTVGMTAMLHTWGQNLSQHLHLHKIWYGSPVVRIERSESGGVRVVFKEPGGHQSLPADRVVVAVPFSVLRRIEIVPPFSDEKTRAIRDLTYASSSKVFLQTRTRFWAKGGLNGVAYTDLLGYMQVLELGHNQPGPRGLLVGYTKMSGARQISDLDEAQRIAATLEAVTKVHPELPRHFEGGTSKCWDEDPWARGAWATSRPGDMRSLEPHVARPEGRIHFAGEHASPWPGAWMQAALESGERAAREINEAG